MSIKGTGMIGGSPSPSTQYPDKFVTTGATQEKRVREQDLIPEKKWDKAELKRELDALNKWMQSRDTHIKFTLHEELNEYYVQVVNSETDEIVREIPSKKIMDIAAKLQEMIGLLVDERR